MVRLTKEQRLNKRKLFIQKYDDFDKVFTFENLYESYKKCIKNVSWKPSVQKFILDDINNLVQLRISLITGTFRSRGFFEFDIIERGKPRHIRSVCIEERVVQRCLCDYCLIPVLTRSFIYDNGACIPDKGQHFTINRIKRHLREFFNKYGTNGIAVTLDFKSYFENIQHDIIYAIIDNTFTDTKLLWLIHHFVDAFGEQGLGLGSQISQILAVTVADALDHFVKEQLLVFKYVRYNDDMLFLCKNKQEAISIVEQVKNFSEQYKFIIHPDKIKIKYLSKGFTFMKIKFILKETGYIVMLPDKRKVVRVRRKLKRIKRKVDNGIITNHDGFLSWQGWDANISICNSYRQRKEIKDLAINLFGREDFNVLQVNHKWRNRRYSKESIFCEVATEK